MNTIKSLFNWIFRFALLYVLFVVLFIIGSMAVAGLMDTTTVSEPGVISSTSGLLVVALADLFIVAVLILTSNWSSWKLAISLALTYYGVVTFVMQIETWYFLSSITASPQLLPRLFLMGIPIAFVFIPLAVWVLRKGRTADAARPDHALVMPAKQWIVKLASISVVYVALYWVAGYFIAWQNPDLRAFYGQPGAALPFFTHMFNTIHQDPGLFPFQLLRGLLWTVCALPVIRGSKVKPLWTALLVGLLFSVPQNIGHVMANPLLPIASVRISHMIETASSTFVFGLVVVWLFHRQHYSLKDLFRIRRVPGSGEETSSRVPVFEKKAEQNSLA